MIPIRRKGASASKPASPGGRSADATVVYTDRGISPGMQKGIDRARQERRTVEWRSLFP